jgi:hypothetical protein
VTEKEFLDKFSHDYLINLMVKREHLALMVVSTDRETIEQKNFYRTQNGDMYVGMSVYFKLALNLLKEPRKISNGK